ncbi:unnamed protein product [Rhizophagus irregularis]|uniref:Alcohol acetyltransferase n=1 Tax=Rhizophagus irregularis TaxID=588596 RepID=A0A916EBV2_9GLOM|nr:unnamed protein product [Rhizophagus irregularis]CAB5378617.1 unnamed protein product [Rhizophagus irregularis]
MDSPQFRYLNKKELSYIYEGNSNNVTLSSLLTLSHPFKYSQIIQSIKFSLNRIQQYYPMTRSYISMKNDKWCFCEKSFIIPSDSSSSSPIPQNFPPKQISSIVKSDILQNEIPFNWIKISSSNDTILNTLENLCSQEMTNDFIVENNLCRFTLVTSENFTNPSNSQIIDTTKEVGFVFCFLHTAFDGKNIFTITHDFIKEFKRILLNSQINMTSDLIIEQELKEGQINNLILPKYQTFYSNLIFFKEILILIGWLIYMKPHNLPFSTSSSSQIQSQLQSEKSEKFYQSNQTEIKTITYFHTLTKQETSNLIKFCKNHKFSITSLLSTCISEIISTKNGYNTVLGGLAVDLRQFLNISKKINGAFNSSILIRHPKVEHLLKDENFDKKFYMKYLINRIIITNDSIQNSMKSGFIFHNLKFLINEPIKNNNNNNNNNIIINEGEEIKNNSIIPLGYVLSNLGICNQNIFDNDSTDNNIITDWNNVFLSSTAKSSRGSNIEVTTLTLNDKMYISFCACSKFISDEDLRDFANNVLDLISQKNDHWVMYLPKNVFLEKYPSSEVTKECYSACYNFGV